MATTTKACHKMDGYLPAWYTAMVSPEAATSRFSSLVVNAWFSPLPECDGRILQYFGAGVGMAVLLFKEIYAVRLFAVPVKKTPLYTVAFFGHLIRLVDDKNLGPCWPEVWCAIALPCVFLGLSARSLLRRPAGPLWRTTTQGYCRLFGQWRCCWVLDSAACGRMVMVALAVRPSGAV